MRRAADALRHWHALCESDDTPHGVFPLPSAAAIPHIRRGVHLRCYARQSTKATQRKETMMLWALIVILLVLWLLGFLVVPVAGGLVHILLVIALIVLIYQLVTGRRV